MIHEEICTYEVCKLAKEKGFPQEFNYPHFKSKLDYYNHKGELNGDVGDILKLRIKHKPVPEEMKPIAAPTQSLLQRWLREQEGIYVYIFPHHIEGKIIYASRAIAPNQDDALIPQFFDTYELALEDALKYALENLV